jgi:hypothetical protein
MIWVFEVSDHSPLQHHPLHPPKYWCREVFITHLGNRWIWEISYCWSMRCLSVNMRDLLLANKMPVCEYERSTAGQWDACMWIWEICCWPMRCLYVNMRDLLLANEMPVCEYERSTAGQWDACMWIWEIYCWPMRCLYVNMRDLLANKMPVCEYERSPTARQWDACLWICLFNLSLQTHVGDRVFIVRGGLLFAKKFAMKFWNLENNFKIDCKF